jgi:cytoskeletal protein CcmA (bactofilin family)
MPSTYTLNNGIELIATGEQSGTWGDTTNLNLGLVDTALDGQVTVTLPAAGSSGSPNALAISDGSASDGRNRLIIFTDGGDLGATAFVQLTPNDAEKIVYIRNNLTGGRAITLFQGTYNASNDYEVPAGTTAVVFFNGGGAGAVAANVFNNAFFDSLRLGGVSVTAILDEDNMASDSATALATQQSIKAYVDAQVGANNELSEVLANGNTSGGTNIQMTTTDEVQFRDTALKISSSVDGQLDIDADVELEITAPTVDINASTAVTIDTTTMTMTGSVNVVGDLDVDNLNLNGNAIISTNTNGNIALTPNGVRARWTSRRSILTAAIRLSAAAGRSPRNHH